MILAHLGANEAIYGPKRVPTRSKNAPFTCPLCWLSQHFRQETVVIAVFPEGCLYDICHSFQTDLFPLVPKMWLFSQPP